MNTLSLMERSTSLIVITNLPSFYKINLFNRIAAQREIFVVFTSDRCARRNEDFYTGRREFPYVDLARRPRVHKCAYIRVLLHTTPYRQLIIDGWDRPEAWVAAFSSPREKNGIIVESSVFESRTDGVKGFLKRLYCRRFSRAYVSGRAQGELLDELGFGGELIVTKGVGIFNIMPQPRYTPVGVVKNFLYVGRLSGEKNLSYLIETFNALPELTLNIVGYGRQEEELRSIAKSNTVFHGAVPNGEMYKYYQRNDVFILPSVSEPWGMVVEEALNNGLPVIVSDMVGCSTEIVTAEKNGLIFDLGDKDGLKKAVGKILDPEFYNSLRLSISSTDYTKISEEQVNCYLQ